MSKKNISWVIILNMIITTKRNIHQQKSNLLAEDASQGKHQKKLKIILLSPFLYKNSQNHKVDSYFLLYSNFTATVLPPRGLKFDMGLLLPTDFPYIPQEN